jgi:hypothetical protein
MKNNAKVRMQNAELKKEHSRLNLFFIHPSALRPFSHCLPRSTPSRFSIEQWLDVSNVLTAYSCAGSVGFEEK